MPLPVNFANPGAAAYGMIAQALAQQEAKRRQDFLDQLTQRRTMADIANQEASRRLQERGQDLNERIHTAQLKQAADLKEAAAAQNYATTSAPGVVAPDMAQRLEAHGYGGMLQKEPGVDTVAPTEPETPDNMGGSPEPYKAPGIVHGLGGSQWQEKRREEQARADAALAAEGEKNARASEALASREQLQREHEAFLKELKKSTGDTSWRAMQSGESWVAFNPKTLETRAINGPNGQPLTKPLGATSANRADSAQALVSQGKDIDTAIDNAADSLGPLVGRYTTVQQFLGNPPPEFSNLIGEIESFSLANMGVHGMRNIQGAHDINAALNAKFTPENLKAYIHGLTNFSHKFLQTVGREKAGGAAAAPGGVEEYVRNPTTGKLELKK